MLKAVSDFCNSLALIVASFFEREAGYQMVSLALIVFGVLLGDPKARGEASHDLLVFGLGVMARSMGSKKAPQSQP